MIGNSVHGNYEPQRRRGTEFFYHEGIRIHEGHEEARIKLFPCFFVVPLRLRMFRTVTPLYCIECDSNEWYRWNGRSYEANLFAVGEPISVATYEKEVTLGVFARPTRDSKLIAKIAACTPAKLLTTRGASYDTRWYFVEVQPSKPLRGWIPAAFASESDCIG